jgi:cytochrome c-type biogenesis protein CcmH/NrfG
MWAMIWVATLGGAFYGGLKMSDYWKQPSSNGTDSTAVQLKKAREAIDRGEAVKVTADLTNLIQREPQNAEVRYLMGRAFMEQAKYKEALDSFEEAVKLQKNFAEAWLYAAAAEKALNNKAKADEKLEQYLEAKKPQAPVIQAPGNH